MTQLPNQHYNLHSNELRRVDNTTVCFPSNSVSTKKVRKRAVRACLGCRARKVRCDVSSHGPPCTNCSLDGMDCAVQPRVRKNHTVKTTTNDQPEITESIISAKAGRPKASSNFPFSPEVNSRRIEGSSYPANNIGKFKSLDGALKAGQSDRSICRPVFQHEIEQIPQYMSLCSELRHNTNLADSFVNFTNYSFVDPSASWGLSPREISFLEQCGSFNLPTKSTLDEVFTQYFSYVHTVIPLLSEAEFWAMYSTQTTTLPVERTVPLFVLQAMIFVSCPFLAPSSLQRLGFSSVPKACADFYLRAKSLFDIQHQNMDGVASAQGALMLTYHMPTISDRTNELWLDKAIHFARTVGADRYFSIDDSSPKKYELKRIWWCCILRDRIMALGFRRPLHIRDSDFDFNQPGLSDNDFEVERLGPSVYDLTTKNLLFQLVIANCKLAVILGEVLSIVYPANTTRKFAAASDRLRRMKESLKDMEKWLETALATFDARIHFAGSHESLILFTKMAYICYHAAKAALYNQIILLTITMKQTGDNLDTLLFAIQLDGQLRNIADHLLELESHSLVTYLPNTFVAITAHPFVWCILDAKIVNDGLQTPESKMYNNILTGLAGLYDGASNVLRIAREIVNHIVANEIYGGPWIETNTQDIIEHDRAVPELVVNYLASVPAHIWFGLSSGSPQKYLRIATIVDYCLAYGRFPTTNEFPKLESNN